MYMYIYIYTCIYHTRSLFRSFDGGSSDQNTSDVSKLGQGSQEFGAAKPPSRDGAGIEDICEVQSYIGFISTAVCNSHSCTHICTSVYIGIGIDVDACMHVCMYVCMQYILIHV